MQNRLITIKYIPVVFVILLFGCMMNNEPKTLVVRQTLYTALAVQQDGKENGEWGYVIFKENKLLIQQFTIPALEGNQYFSGREAAAKTGDLVAEKLNKGIHPGITKHELDSLGIIQLQDDTKKK